MQEKEKNHRLNSAINDWRQWPLPLRQRPKVFAELNGGDINATLVIGDKEKKWTLKLFGHSEKSDRKNKIEARAQQAAHPLGIAAELLYRNEEQRYQISEFIAGKTLRETEENSAPQNKRAAVLSALVSAIKKLQKVSLDIPQIIYVERVENYWGKIPHRHRIPLEAQYHHALEKAIKLDQSTTADEAVLCHHDLNPGNILRKEKKEIHLALIDWEFAVRGPATMDFAILSVELDYDIEKLSRLSGHSQSSLILAADIYRTLCQLYNAAQQF